MKTPFLVQTNYKSFDEYLQKLSKKSLYNYKETMKKFNNFLYEKLSFQNGIYLKDSFEYLWSKQLIRGHSINKPNITLQNNTHFFCCKINNEIVMLHIIEYYKNYIYCHMPMYDKNKYNGIAKYAWFNLIKYVIENTDKIGIDMGGVCGRDFSHHCNGRCNQDFTCIIKNRKYLTKYAYKYLYLTKEEKNLETAKKYVIINNSVVILS
jgi:hypothetical protein